MFKGIYVSECVREKMKKREGERQKGRNKESETERERLGGGDPFEDKA